MGGWHRGRTALAAADAAHHCHQLARLEPELDVSQPPGCQRFTLLLIRTHLLRQACALFRQTRGVPDCLARQQCIDNLALAAAAGFPNS